MTIIKWLHNNYLPTKYKGKNKMTNENLRVEKEGDRTYLIVPHQGGELKVNYNFVRGDHLQAKRELNLEGLVEPTMAEVASILHATLVKNPNSPYSKEIESVFPNFLRVFNGILYVPNEGAYIQDRPEVKDEKIIMDKNQLIKKLEAHDPSVRFVPFGFKKAELEPEELAENKFIIALASKEGAEKLADLAKVYSVKKHTRSYMNGKEIIGFNPYIRSYEKVKSDQVHVATIGDDSSCGYGVYVSCTNFWQGIGALSLGIKR